jgi:Tripartite tricarboxylate transporter family receptor
LEQLTLVERADDGGDHVHQLDVLASQIAGEQTLRVGSEFEEPAVERSRELPADRPYRVERLFDQHNLFRRTLAQIPYSVFRVTSLREMPFDSLRDLTYVVGLTGYTFGVIVRNDAPWKTFPDLLADAKARPGKISYGSPGGGTTPHITMERIARQQGIDWVHVPFKGSAATTNAILGGHVDRYSNSQGLPGFRGAASRGAEAAHRGSSGCGRIDGKPSRQVPRSASTHRQAKATD